MIGKRFIHSLKKASTGSAYTDIWRIAWYGMALGEEKAQKSHEMKWHGMGLSMN